MSFRNRRSALERCPRRFLLGSRHERVSDIEPELCVEVDRAGNARDLCHRDEVSDLHVVRLAVASLICPRCSRQQPDAVRDDIPRIESSSEQPSRPGHLAELGCTACDKEEGCGGFRRAPHCPHQTLGRRPFPRCVRHSPRHPRLRPQRPGGRLLLHGRQRATCRDRAFDLQLRLPNGDNPAQGNCHSPSHTTEYAGLVPIAA